MVFAPSWCELQRSLKLDYLISMDDYKKRIKDYLITQCTCPILCLNVNRFFLLCTGFMLLVLSWCLFHALIICKLLSWPGSHCNIDLKCQWEYSW